MDAGLNTIYLQFDGLNDEIYIAARGRKLLDIKLKVIENCRKLEHPPSIVLVPTIVKGINDDQVGEIIQVRAQELGRRPRRQLTSLWLSPDA